VANQSLPDSILAVLSKFYHMMDIITPPDPSWKNDGALRKQNLWVYYHNCAMNHPHIIEQLKTVAPEMGLDITVPEEVVEAARSNMKTVLTLPELQPYREKYGMAA